MRIELEFEWRFDALSASKAIFRGEQTVIRNFESIQNIPQRWYKSYPYMRKTRPGGDGKTYLI